SAGLLAGIASNILPSAVQPANASFTRSSRPGCCPPRPGVSTFHARPLGDRIASGGAAATSGGAGRSPDAAVAPPPAPGNASRNTRISEFWVSTRPFPEIAGALVTDFRGRSPPIGGSVNTFVAAGGGEFLTSFATLLGCEPAARPQLARMTQARYETLLQ